jgi:beta-glucanase (GH16 family)
MSMILIGLYALSCVTVAEPADDPNWSLVWSDEFNEAKIDRTKWRFDVDCWGGGNDERQCYTSSKRNATIEDGKLVITARHERVSGPALPAAMRAHSATPDAEVVRQFSSARLTTRDKASWRYGKIEARARLPLGQGVWPAIWMLPERDEYGPWAASGEIDILEAVNLGVPCKNCPGGRENTVLGTLHFGGKWPDNLHKGEEVHAPKVLDGEYHTYSIEWSADRMVWRFDGNVFAIRVAPEWSTTGSAEPGAPFDKPFHLILNLAIGGKLPESRGVGGVQIDGYPKRMEVDWVRVWKRDESGADPIDRAVAED